VKKHSSNWGTLKERSKKSGERHHRWLVYDIRAMTADICTLGRARCEGLPHIKEGIKVVPKGEAALQRTLYFTKIKRRKTRYDEGGYFTNISLVSNLRKLGRALVRTGNSSKKEKRNSMLEKSPDKWRGFEIRINAVSQRSRILKKGRVCVGRKRGADRLLSKEQDSWGAELEEK